MKIGMMLLIFIFSWQLSAQDMLGGSEVGNGGGFVYCVSSVDQTRTPRVTVDYWEMVNIHGYQARHFLDNDSFLEILGSWLDEIPVGYEKVKIKFEETITFYLENVQYVSEVDSLDDLARPEIPSDCYVGPAAHFTIDPLEFYLHLYTFDHFDELNKAIIIFHEVLYYLKLNYAVMTNHHDLRHEVGIFFQNDIALTIPYLEKWKEVLDN